MSYHPDGPRRRTALTPEPSSERCGVTKITGRFEWVCARPPHDDAPDREPGYHGRLVPQAHDAEAHYFVNRWGDGAERR